MDQDNGAALESQQGAAPPPWEPAQGKKRTRAVVQTPVVLTDPATGFTTEAAMVDAVELDAPPASITLAAPYGFIDEDGKLHMWHDAQVIDDADEIAFLLGRGVLIRQPEA